MIKEEFLRVVANVTRKIAATTVNSSASIYYVYQPKVPKALKKNPNNR